MIIRAKSNKREVNICGGPLAEKLNCNDPEVMIKAGIHPPKFILNTQEFIKTSSERERLKTLRRTQSLSGSKKIDRGLNPYNPLQKLIIHVQNDKKAKDFKTTYRYKCKISEVSDILATYHDKQVINKAKLNGIKLHLSK